MTERFNTNNAKTYQTVAYDKYRIQGQIPAGLQELKGLERFLIINSGLAYQPTFRI